MESAPDLEFHAPTIEELQPLFPAYDIGGFIAQGNGGSSRRKACKQASPRTQKEYRPIAGSGGR